MQIWIDLLLTDSRAVALFKLAQITAEKYPEIGLDADLVRHRQRFWCRHMARRTRLDPDGIDLCWLMLAADPANPAVTYGFVDRLGDRFVAWVQQSDNVIPDSIVLNRLDRWSQIRDGEPAKAGDPFAAVTDAVWLQAEDKKGREGRGWQVGRVESAGGEEGGPECPQESG